MKKFKIDFIGIGAPKTGTTWLAEILNEHPEVCISEPKEIHYFNEKNSFAHSFVNKNYKKSFEWYKKRFKHCSKENIKGEFSTGYLMDKKAPILIKKRFPRIKLIACLRNPVDRANSNFWMFKEYLKVEHRSIERAMREEGEYIERGLYFKQISRYLKYFKKEQILFIFLDDIKNEPEKIVRDLYEFIGVSDKNFVPKNIRKKRKNSRKSRFKFLIVFLGLLNGFLVNLGLSGLVNRMKKLGFKRVFYKLNSKKINYPDLPSKTKIFLKKSFKSDICKLEKLLNKDLSHWKK